MDDCDNISVISTIVPYIGREKERYLLEEIYKKGRCFGQVVWISGASGVGKSALIQDFLSEKKYVCSGKFDFMKHPSTPYSAIVMIMSDLCSILEEAQERCVNIILCPESIAILSKLVPQITTITQCEEDDNDDDDDGNDGIGGKQYTESQRRRNQEKQIGEWGFETLKGAIKSFVKKAIAIISSYSITPLIILMDNLQWADDASLDILRNALEDCINIHRFIFVGSYRDNEIESNSAFWDFKENLDRKKENSYDSSIDNSSGGKVEISLDSLTLEDVIHLVANIIQMNPIQSEELGRLVYDITRGDALFVKRYLYHVMERKMIRPRDNGPGWDFDDVKLRAQVEVGEDIVNFLTEEMRRLPSSTIEVLKIASFMGPEVDIILLETIVHTWEDTILSSDQTFYGILEQMESRGYIVIDDNDDNDSKGVFHFPHDRILRAAYCLVSEENVQQFHLRIGRLILQIHYDEYQESKSKNMLLLAIDQLNRGRTWIETIEETNDLAMLNLQAAQEMIAWSAFNLAKSHLMISLELLGEHCWRDHYEMTLKVSNLLASVLSGNGSMLECLDLIETISQHCTSPEDRYFTQVIRLEILTCIHRLDDCIQASMTMLSELRFPKIPSHPGYSMIVSSVMEVKRLLKTLSSEEILSLPLCNDKRIEHAVKILGILCPVALYASRESMIPIITSRMLLLSLRHGLTDSSPYAFGAFGFSLAISGDIDGAFQFGSLAIRMMERLGEDARTLVMVYGLFYHIKRPILDGLKPTLRAYYVAFAQGDMAFSGQAIAMHLISRMVAGLSLENIIADTFSFCDQLKAYNQSMMWNVLLILQRGNLELANRSDEIAKLTGEIHDDDAFVSYLLGFRVDYFDFQYSLFTLRSRFYLEDEESTHILAEKFWNFKGVHGPYCHSVLYFLFSALVALECWKKAGVTQRFRFWRLFRKFQRLLTAWTKKGDPNTLHLVYLLDAEVVATKKNVLPLDVQRMYHQSISQARRVGFIQDAALANERLGEYFLSKQDHDWAQYYLQNAKVLYYDWGAKKKVQQMERKYGELVEIKVTEDDLSKSLTGRARQEIISDIDEIRARTRVSLRENRIISVSA